MCKACIRHARRLLGTPRTSSRSVRWQSTSSRLSTPPPLKVAVIGAGPSGFYAASRILSLLPRDSPKGQDVRVHLYERLPTPYGLVRYGVAPDHPEVKNCQHKFDELSDDSRFTFLGNVSIGSQPSSSTAQPTPSTALSPYTYPHALHLPLAELLPHYSTVILTYGASLSNPLSSVAGSSSSPSPLPGVHPALALVGWYNGHPAFAHLAPDLRKVENVAVIGHGNVALDVSRILLKTPESLSESDIPEDVLHLLSQSKVRKVTATGRRGPGQIAFTTKEFREMLHLPGVVYKGIDPILAHDAKKAVEGDRMRKRLLGLMEKRGAADGDKQFQLDFLKSPKTFHSGSSGRVGSVEWTINELLEAVPDPPQPPASQTESIPKSGSGTIIARPTGETTTTLADMVVESVGYRSEPLGVGEEWHVPFDEVRGKVRNVGGRVVDNEGAAIPGMYAAGWSARGPVGVIASTMQDAYALSELILDDYAASAKSPHTLSLLGQDVQRELPSAVEHGLKHGKVVDLKRWKKIDQAEVDNAKSKGSRKEREKFTKVEDMLSV